MFEKLKAFLEEQESGLSSEFEEAELQEYLQMAKEFLKSSPFYYGQKRVIVKAASFAAFALATDHLTKGIESKSDHYQKMKEDLNQQYDQLLKKSKHG